MCAESLQCWNGYTLEWWRGTGVQNLGKEWGIVCLTSVCPSCADSSWALEMPLSASRACPLSSGLMDSVFSRNSFKAPSVSWILGARGGAGDSSVVSPCQGMFTICIHLSNQWGRTSIYHESIWDYLFNIRPCIRDTLLILCKYFSFTTTQICCINCYVQHWGRSAKQKTEKQAMKLLTTLPTACNKNELLVDEHDGEERVMKRSTADI